MYKVLAVSLFCLGTSLTACQSQKISTDLSQPEFNNPISPKQLPYHSVFQPIAAEIVNKTQIPVYLPTYIPETDFVYSSIERVTATEYSIILGYGENCNGGTACRLGSISGKKLASQNISHSGQTVDLVNDITGYFTDANCGANCSDSTLSWEQNDVFYTVGLKAGKLDSLIKIANSANNISNEN